MPVLINLRHLEREEQQLEGEVNGEDLDLGAPDELVRLAGPVRYDLTVERMGDGLLVMGRLACELACECARCLQPFTHRLELDPWACQVPLTGEDRVPVANDCVDLTPSVREDILLAFPQHPLCGSECRGLPSVPPTSVPKPGDVRPSQTATDASAWAALDQLKF